MTNTIKTILYILTKFKFIYKILVKRTTNPMFYETTKLLPKILLSYKLLYATVKKKKKVLLFTVCPQD